MLAQSQVWTFINSALMLILEVAEDVYVHKKGLHHLQISEIQAVLTNYENLSYIIETIKGQEHIPVGFHTACYTLLMTHHLL